MKEIASIKYNSKQEHVCKWMIEHNVHTQIYNNIYGCDQLADNTQMFKYKLKRIIEKS